MAVVLGDRVLETSTTQGTGTLNLAGATTGFQTFVAAVGTGAQVSYLIDDGTDWEAGIGTVTDGTPDTLSRDTILQSSNADAAVNWGSGTRNVRLTVPAGIFPTLRSANIFTDTNTFTGVVAINGTAATAAGVSMAEDTDNGTNKVTIKAPATLAADYTLTLPSDDGTANQRLTTDGSGALSWFTTKSTRQYLTSGTGATYTTPTGCTAILVRAWGAGGGGGAAATNAGATGGNTTFNSVVANGGSGGEAGGSTASGGAGGTGGSGSATFRMAGHGGFASRTIGGHGGITSLGGTSRTVGSGTPANAAANSGSGGQGAPTGSTTQTGGGGAGEYFELYISSPAATYTYTITAGGAGGAAGTTAGGDGGSGLIIVEEYY